MEPQFTEFLYRDSVIWIAAFTLGGFVFALGPIATRVRGGVSGGLELRTRF